MKIFSEEEAIFIKNGTGIDIIPNKEIQLTREEAEIIVDYSFDIESEEAMKALKDGVETEISHLGHIAGMIATKLTVNGLKD